MISSKEMKYEQDNPVPNGTVCTALYDALPEYHIDLDFKKGDKVVIVEPCNVLFFYIGRNEEGKSGVVPINYFTFETKSGDDQGDSEPAANRDGNRYVTSHSPQVPPQVAPRHQSPIANRRVPGSPVLSRPPVAPRGSNTLPAGSSLSGYHGHDDPPAVSRISSSVEDEIDRRPPCPLPPEATNPVNPILATDNFKKTSGWFTPSVQQVIANKSTFSVQALSKVRAGIYIFAHKYNHKLTYCGGSCDLLNDIALMLEHLYVKNDLRLTPLEKELRRYPSANEWIVRLKISITQDDLYLELAKCIITHDTLEPNGLNTELQLYTKSDWVKFTEWAKDK